MKKIRVRFAPSPTGFLHVGGLRTALYDYLFAKKEGGDFVLRIEDTDRTRLVEGGVENIIRTLSWAGIEPDEGPFLNEEGKIGERGEFGPYVQSKRLDIYREYVNQLLESGHAYRCFCTSERLEEMREKQRSENGRTMYDRHCRKIDQETCQRLETEGKPHVIRLKTPDSGVTAWDDLIRGRVEIANDQIDDQVLLKSDGFPTYHLAVVVDDHLMQISHIFRGEEWCPSTPKHILLYRAFGWEIPEYAHLPLLLNPDRSKLSKRQGDVAVEDYQKKGYLPEALINFVALLGWNPSGDREIYTVDELSKSFDLSKINRGGAVFDLEKLDWMNSEYIKFLPDSELAERAYPFFAEAGFTDREKVGRAVVLEKTRVKTLAEMPERLGFIFSRPVLESDLIPWKKSTAEIAKNRLSGLREFLAGLETKVFENKDLLEKTVLEMVIERGWTNAETLWPMRVSLTGQKASPGPFEVAWAIGKEETLARLEGAIELI